MNVAMNEVIVLRRTDVTPVMVLNLVSADLHPPGYSLKVDRDDIYILVGRDVS